MNEFLEKLSESLEKVKLEESNKKEIANNESNYNLNKDIGILILKYRKFSGITQKELSKKSGISQANISKIERGHYIPSLDVLKKIADALGYRVVVDFINFDN